MPPAGLTHASGVGQARKFRLAVVLVVLGVLWWFLLGVLEREARNAEERAANMVIGQLRSALVIKGVVNAWTCAPSIRRTRSTPAVMFPHWSDPPVCKTHSY